MCFCKVSGLKLCPQSLMQYSTNEDLAVYLCFLLFQSIYLQETGAASLNFPDFFQDIIGKTDTEIFSGAGVKESLDFKREVLERGLPGKREITFETELFGSKTFLIYVEPVFNKAGETIGVNYIGMDITDQVSFRSVGDLKHHYSAFLINMFFDFSTGQEKRKDGKAPRGDSCTESHGD